VHGIEVDGVEEKLKRADKHLHALRKEVNVFVSEDSYTLKVTEFDAKTGEGAIGAFGVKQPAARVGRDPR
jgi:hypothetical protein